MKDFGGGEILSRACLGKHLRAMTAVGGAGRLFDLQGASTQELGTVGDAGR